jgi:tripartite-type tricarboxylate transporter receptor subunit TctC
MSKVLRGVCALLLAVTAGILPARAQDYPNRPIRLIVGYVPGGASDISARLLAEVLGTRLGQSVVVENKPGAASVIGIDYVAKAPPDGYTLLHTNSDGIAITPALKSNLPFAVPKDFTFITRIVQLPLVVAVRANLPVNSLAELIAYAKANPGKLRYGTSGVGSGPHLATLLLEKQAGIKMLHVPYKGSGAAINDLIGGHIDLSLPAVQPIAPYAEAGKVKLLAVTGEARDPLVPNVPTMKESGLPGATVVIWFGLLGPAGMPANVVDRLRKDAVAALNSPEAKKKYKAAGFETDPLAGDEFEKFAGAEYKLWKELATSEHIVLDE